jgi:hypothetical protein
MNKPPINPMVMAGIKAVQNRKPVVAKSSPHSGGKWEVMQEFKGKSHDNGGINLEVGDGYVRKIDGTEEADDIAKNGVVIKSPAKKYTATINGKTRSFGAKGYSISPGTPKGDNYCARSSGIKKCANPPCPNDLSRKAWGCVGKKSVASKAVKFQRK